MFIWIFINGFNLNENKQVKQASSSLSESVKKSLEAIDMSLDILHFE